MSSKVLLLVSLGDFFELQVGVKLLVSIDHSTCLGPWIKTAPLAEGRVVQAFVNLDVFGLRRQCTYINS
jgi:hypothetical protein